MFWEIFLELCNQHNTSPTAVVLSLGLSRGSVTSWKEGKTPYQRTLVKISDYFNVSVDYLVGKTDKKEKPVTEDELSEEVVIYHRDGKKVTRHFTKEQMEMIAQMLDGIPEKK